MSVFLFLASPVVLAREVAIIVHKDNSIQDLAFRDLTRIFKAEQTHWPNDGVIYFILQEKGSAAKEIMLKKIYGMDDKELKVFWLAAIFQGKLSSFPKTAASDEAVKFFVGSIPSAIGFINSASVDESVKVVAIDGKLPGQAGYPLKGGGGDDAARPLPGARTNLKNFS